jgi:hypothetical protein
MRAAAVGAVLIREILDVRVLLWWVFVMPSFKLLRRAVGVLEVFAFQQRLDAVVESAVAFLGIEQESRQAGIGLFLGHDLAQMPFVIDAVGK